jgi:hypothetical protein
VQLRVRNFSSFTPEQQAAFRATEPSCPPHDAFSIEEESVIRSRHLKDALAHFDASGQGNDDMDWLNPSAQAHLEEALNTWKQRGCSQDQGR